ncbi:intein-containing RctB family protein [Candidatus Omnitrophota bacterium]
MSQLWNGPLEKIDDYRWRIPKSYNPGMRVPGIIYADENLLRDIRSDRATEQVANVAHLPGIVKYSLAMPDIHWGYGMPIGGVAATDIEKGGVVGAGLVGYDVNCLCATSFINNELGYKIRIKDYEKNLPRRNIVCMDFAKAKAASTKIVAFLKQRPKTKVLNILTETERQITATADHPFYTKDGMKKLQDLSLNEEVAIYPFEGVEYKEPSSDVLIDREDIKRFILKLGKDSRGHALKQILNFLDQKNILPLRYDSWQLPYLLKIMGYCFGDGTLYFAGKRNRGTTCFYGKKADLQQIQADIKKLGFEGVGIYSRHRHHKIKTAYTTVEFETEEASVKVGSSSFAVLLTALGMPIGNKCRQAYRLPQWLLKAPLWQKRLFLAGLFGAELSSPQTITMHGYNFYCPTLSMNKSEKFLENGRRFLEEIASLLSEFDVTCHEISQRKEFVNKQGIVSYRFRLMVSGITENLIKLYGGIGFEYNAERSFLANVATQYLKLKNRIIKERKCVAALAPQLHGSGVWDRKCLDSYLTASPYISPRFVERSYFETRNTNPRFWGEDPTFQEYLKKATRGLGRSGMVWDSIESIDEIPEYDDYVYDFTVAHKDHNFIADNFVVSNCGVRLVRTNLEEKDVKSKIRDLVYALFNNIPAGVGSKGKITASGQEQKKLLVKGAQWAVERGYGTAEDLDYTEENGAIAGADPQAVSPRALERGQKQPGTLGSGNHFLEIQVIDQIYDQAAAGVFGLHPGQITVMIHTGSRGFGHQVCDDYAKAMIRTLGKFGIQVPDRQLACTPVKSSEGQAYLGAMRCAANYAWCNRQILMELTRRVFQKFFNLSPKDLGMDLIYDVAHNIAKIEKHNVDGQEKTLCVHRKGATRAFPPGHPDLPQRYRQIGQPVIIPGDMGRNSFLLAGTEQAAETFYSTCHGSGRVLSRTAAIKNLRGRSVAKELEQKGIYVCSAGRDTLAEEAPEAYKNVNDVVDVVHQAGISKRVCRMRPLGVIKG